MSKRQRSISSEISSAATTKEGILHTSKHDAKRPRMSGRRFNPIKVATAEAAAIVDADPPCFKIQEYMQQGLPNPSGGKAVLYWMRLADLRISDNRALARASECAKDIGVPLLVLFILSPQDYIAHDRSSRRIDFVLRNLVLLQNSFHELHIPFYIITHTPRKAIPERVFELLKEYECNHLFANLEYEVDELRRDLRIWKFGEKHGIQVNFFHNKNVIEPGVIRTKQGKGYTVYSPYWRSWIDTLNRAPDKYIKESPEPSSNQESIRQDKKFSALFGTSVPDAVPGFELDEKEGAKMEEYWPAGELAANEILERFLKTRARPSQMGAVNPLNPGAQDTEQHSRIAKYKDARDQMDKDTTSRLSVYLSSGVLSIRECIRRTMVLSGSKKVECNFSSGVGRWIQELAWRDFYTGVLCHYPRVSMGRPYHERYSEVVWEDHQVKQDSARSHEHHEAVDGEMLQRWKEGKTGVPIVDATMRCIREMGWVHNRARMITAMYLTKDLMIDWRVGERYFMQNLIDGDLASNNGGWQWCASTGVDPCPYFRIFNPHSQSLKTDPSGEFIRHWVPELEKVCGPDLHNLSVSLADKLGYPREMIDHSKARDRALRRFKNIGEE